MTERVIPPNVIAFLDELKQDREKGAKEWYDLANKAYDNQQRMINTVNGNMLNSFGLVYKMIKYTMEAVNTVDSLIEKLSEKSADKEQVEAIRVELTTKVNKTLGPIKEEIEKQRERDKRGSNIGIQ